MTPLPFPGFSVALIDAISGLANTWDAKRIHRVECHDDATARVAVKSGRHNVNGRAGESRPHLRGSDCRLGSEYQRGHRRSGRGRCGSAKKRTAEPAHTRDGDTVRSGYIRLVENGSSRRGEISRRDGRGISIEEDLAGAVRTEEFDLISANKRSGERPVGSRQTGGRSRRRSSNGVGTGSRSVAMGLSVSGYP